MKRAVIFMLALIMIMPVWGQWIEGIDKDPFDDSRVILLVKEAENSKSLDKILAIREKHGILEVFITMETIIKSRTMLVRFGDNDAGYIYGNLSGTETAIFLPVGTVYEMLQVDKMAIRIYNGYEQTLIFILDGLQELCEKYGITDKKNPDYYIER